MALAATEKDTFQNVSMVKSSCKMK